VRDPAGIFPSLHASLSTTVAILAWESRAVYPRWVVVALPLAAGVGFATMYLGIHWALDVVGGICLGVVSVTIADYLSYITDF
jgi:membrane-associated phospholipid phosphatase